MSSAALGEGAFNPRRLALLSFMAGRAVLEMALARVRHLALSVPDIHALNKIAAARGRSHQDALNGDEVRVDRVSYVMPRVAKRLPWRSDCLIQAMAAQRWLGGKGIATSILIGVDKPVDTGFAAHAWLQYGERVVTGGEIANFKILVETTDNQK